MVVAVPHLLPQAGEGAPVIAETPAPSAHRFYLPELDLLRLGAFLMVWSAHACFAFQGLLPGRLLSLVNGTGSLGVPVFFFLSAYLITELLRREQSLTGTVHIPAFYLRRVLRIWPLYFGILVAYALLGLAFRGFRVEPARLAASCLLAGNWYLLLHPGLTTPLRHLWSVSVEEQWYLLWPLAMRALPRAGLLGTCALFITAAFALLGCAAVWGHGQWVASAAWLNSGVQFQYFALGAATALLFAGRIPRPSPWARAGLGTLGACGMVAAAAACGVKQGNGPAAANLLPLGYLLAGIGTLGLFFSVLGVSLKRCPRALVRLGQVSFGLYVFHETAFFLVDEAAKTLGVQRTLRSVIATRLAALALTVGLAAVSYRFWEMPFLRLKRRWTFVRSREAV